MSRLPAGPAPAVLCVLAGLAGCAPTSVMHECYDQAKEIEYVDEYLVDRSDHWQTPAETMKLGTGDCEDKAIYLCYLLRRRGVTSRPVVGKRAPGAQGRHVWVECVNPTDGREYILDPSLFTVMPTSERKKDEYVERVLDFEKRILDKMLSDALKAP